MIEDTEATIVDEKSESNMVTQYLIVPACTND